VEAVLGGYPTCALPPARAQLEAHDKAWVFPSPEGVPYSRIQLSTPVHGADRDAAWGREDREDDAARRGRHRYDAPRGRGSCQSGGHEREGLFGRLEFWQEVLSMGAMWGRRIELVTALSENAGYRSGLALSREELTTHLDGEHDWVLGDDDDVMRVRSEEYADALRAVLYRLGTIPRRDVIFPGIAMFHKYRGDPAKLALYERVMTLFRLEFKKAVDVAKQNEEPADLTPFLEIATKSLDSDGLRMALEIIQETMIFYQQSPWSTYRHIEWADMLQLKELFESEGLSPKHGEFVDQRFIAYLNRDFTSIDRINWRKFEGLAAEFFARAGFHVEVGPGRNDDGVDVRVWPDQATASGPPALLVQCKRQKEHVDKVVVKALWADIQHEKAKSGLIVTTTKLSPGAEKVCSARAYPIKAAERTTLASWIEAMHRVSAGVFMGE
jgi:restriction system protein